jgi:hypothetical protein
LCLPSLSAKPEILLKKTNSPIIVRLQAEGQTLSHDFRSLLAMTIFRYPPALSIPLNCLAKAGLNFNLSQSAAVNCSIESSKITAITDLELSNKYKERLARYWYSPVSSTSSCSHPIRDNLLLFIQDRRHICLGWSYAQKPIAIKRSNDNGAWLMLGKVRDVV